MPDSSHTKHFEPLDPPTDRERQIACENCRKALGDQGTSRGSDPEFFLYDDKIQELLEIAKIFNLDPENIKARTTKAIAATRSYEIDENSAAMAKPIFVDAHSKYQILGVTLAKLEDELTDPDLRLRVDRTRDFVTDATAALESIIDKTIAQQRRR